MKSLCLDATILILEDDNQQMDLLANFALSEIKKLFDNSGANDKQREKIQNIKIVKVGDISSLQNAVSKCENVVLAILDCNTPDAQGEAAHDQLVKTNYKITGRHRSVDIVTEHLPDTPITMISSLNRFQSIVHKYYERKHDMSINFISKNDLSMIGRNIGYYLRRYIGSIA